MTAPWVVAAACAFGAALAGPTPETPPAVPRASVVPFEGGTRVDLVFDGGLLGWAAPRDGVGRRTLYVLVRGATAGNDAGTDCTVGPRADALKRDARLYRWSPGAAQTLDLVRSDLPQGALDAVDLDGDGAEDLVLLRAGGIDRVATEPGDRPATTTIAQDPDLGVRSGDPRVATGASEDPFLRIAVLGAFRTWANAPDGRLRLASSLDLPIGIDTDASGVTVRSPEVLPIGRARSGRMLYATAPEAVGFERVRTFLLDPDGPAETRSVECWVRFPERERLLESGFSILDGSPVLIALTVPADTLRLFGGKKLRVFPLASDRTRVGEAPLLATETDINLWQAASPFVIDLDGDGRDDLVLGYWKGIKKTIAALEVHRGVGGGRFGPGRTSAFEVADGAPDFLTYGRDLDGDGRPDLALFEARALQVYPGSPPGRAERRPVGSTASLVLPVTADTPMASSLSVEFRLSSSSLSVGRRAPGAGDPRFIDLDGDGLAEILFVGDRGANAAASIFLVRRPEKVGADNEGASGLARRRLFSYK
jgi:hypothetical protein